VLPRRKVQDKWDVVKGNVTWASRTTTQRKWQRLEGQVSEKEWTGRVQLSGILQGKPGSK
jgi:hypothetical protein